MKQAWNAFHKTNSLFCNKIIDISLRTQLVRYYVFFFLLCGDEAWASGDAQCKKMDSSKEDSVLLEEEHPGSRTHFSGMTGVPDYYSKLLYQRCKSPNVRRPSIEDDRRRRKCIVS
ncbi:hypothetical protein WA026_007232 [Henosepilachna vigintioctopunctata]|uniref:Uncharacterized protein n=1 Tax=Henosepilachna vigintioctopunctata TaxID=420089 RepID=A0AAW1VA01_9CUCU